jgi:nitrite reductase/ring-hydroxylating ferredoxin subunit
VSSPESNTPLWKDEFSVHAADERYVSRRQFTKFLVLTSLAMFVGQVWIVFKSWFGRQPARNRPVTVASTDEIAPGQVKLFTYPTPQDHCILLCTAPNQYVAYSQKCTHLSCAVYYQKETNRLACPCHNGFFAVDDGRVLAGPPTGPLPRIELLVEGARIMAADVQGA